MKHDHGTGIRFLQNASSPGYRDRRHGLEQIDSIPEHLALHKTSERERPKETQPAWENSSLGWFEAVHQW